MQPRYGDITLTEAGYAYGRSVLDRHRMLFDFLTKALGIEPEVAEVEACQMEHAISDASFEKWARSSAASTCEQGAPRRLTDNLPAFDLTTRTRNEPRQRKDERTPVPRQANIVSFDTARRVASDRRARQTPPVRAHAGRFADDPDFEVRVSGRAASAGRSSARSFAAPASGSRYAPLSMSDAHRGPGSLESRGAARAADVDDEEWKPPWGPWAA